MSERFIHLTTDKMPLPQYALLSFCDQFVARPSLKSKLLNEIDGYVNDGSYFTHDKADICSLFQFASSALIARITLSTLETCLKPGIFPNYFSNLYANALFKDAEASSRFLLSRNYSLLRLAEGICPVINKSDFEIYSFELLIAFYVDPAIDEAKDRQLSTFASILECRKKLANQRLQSLRDPK